VLGQQQAEAGITRLSSTLGMWPTGWMSARKPSPRSANRSRWRGWIPAAHVYCAQQLQQGGFAAAPGQQVQLTIPSNYGRIWTLG
jgi:hypothetical protein